MAAGEVEGVVKFAARHRSQPLAESECGALARRLGGWREVLLRAGLVGRAPDRYGGAGFGNVSARVDDGPGAPGQRRFLVTGTQTGHVRRASLADFCVVERYDAARNQVDSVGPVGPSSESMTHGAFYDLSPAIRAVFHGHSPTLWRRAAALGLPITSPSVPYGTPAMAAEVARLYRDDDLARLGVLAMGGHEDGVIAFGETVDVAGGRLMTWLARACE